MQARLSTNYRNEVDNQPRFTIYGITLRKIASSEKCEEMKDCWMLKKRTMNKRGKSLSREDTEES
jgi:hypothetical protein